MNLLQIKEQDITLEWVHELIIKNIIRIIIFVSVLSGINSVINEGTFGTFSVAVLVFSLIPYILFKNGWHYFSITLLLFGLNILIFLRGYEIKSAYMLTFLSLILIISAISNKILFTNILFIVDLVVIIFGINSGVFTLSQPVDPEVGAYYANTVTDLLPNIIVAYIISIVIHVILFQALEKLQFQYKKLEDTQDHLIKQEKLSSLQTLAGGIAHDFNNILTSILGALSLVNIADEIGEAERDLLINAEKASNRAKILSAQLLNFSKSSKPHKEIIHDLASLITEVVLFTAKGKSILPHLVISPDLYSIKADKTQISQLLQNLVLNSLQALNEKGEVKILAENFVNHKNLPHLPDGKYVKIAIIDNGSGIPSEILDNLFEPFTTTKISGNGLGLNSSKRIAEKHSGDLILQSTGTTGTEFVLFLPSIGEKLIDKTPAQTKIVNFSGSVLLMDDEPGILLTAQKMLNSIGFKVTTCQTGQKTIDIFKHEEEANNKISLIILDYTVPGGMNGVECYKKLREMSPNVNIIISSGHAIGPTISEFDDKNLKFLAKPYKISQLVDKIQELFGS